MRPGGRVRRGRATSELEDDHVRRARVGGEIVVRGACRCGVPVAGLRVLTLVSHRAVNDVVEPGVGMDVRVASVAGLCFDECDGVPVGTTEELGPRLTG
jgi:hypothetical protein